MRFKSVDLKIKAGPYWPIGGGWTLGSKSTGNFYLGVVFPRIHYRGEGREQGAKIFSAFFPKMYQHGLSSCQFL